MISAKKYTGAQAGASSPELGLDSGQVDISGKPPAVVPNGSAYTGLPTDYSKADLVMDERFGSELIVVNPERQSRLNAVALAERKHVFELGLQFPDDPTRLTLDGEEWYLNERAERVALNALVNNRGIWLSGHDFTEAGLAQSQTTEIGRTRALARLIEDLEGMTVDTSATLVEVSGQGEKRQYRLGGGIVVAAAGVELGTKPSLTVVEPPPADPTSPEVAKHPELDRPDDVSVPEWNGLSPSGQLLVYGLDPNVRAVFMRNHRTLSS